MSTPIRRANQVDPALMYAPPRARKQGQTPSASPVDRPEHLGGTPDFTGDRAIMELKRRISLDPEWVPEPPQSAVNRRDWGKITLGIGGILGCAAAIAWAVVSVPSGRLLLRSDVVGASFLENLVSTNRAEHFPKTLPADRERDVSANAAQESGNLQEPRSRPDPSEPPGATLAAIAPAQSVPVAATRAPASAPIRTTPDFVTRQLDREEMASMLLRADDFIKSGDLSSARLLLERAAEAGDGRAALRLAGTFDPNVLKTLGFQDSAADIAMARLWYERAEKVGSAEARERLRQLASASVR